MNLPRLLIADSDDEFRQALEACFCDHFTVRSCNGGEAAWELLQTFRPDLILMDLILPQIDGISLLYRLRQAQLQTKILILTTLRTPYTTHALQDLQVDYMMLKPCDLQALVQRVRDMTAGAESTPVLPADPKNLVTRMLQQLGFSPKISGFRYLQSAIPLYAADSRQAITKELYATVGAQYQKNAQLVERAIRSAIDTAWRQHDPGIWRRHFRMTPDGSIPRPSNGDLIASLAQALAEQLASQNTA